MGKELPGLAPDQLVKGKVLAATGDGNVLLEVGGQTVSARSLVPLIPGSELWLETGNDANTSVLTLAAKKGSVLDFLKLFIPGSLLPASSAGELADLLNGLLPLLDPAAAASGQALLGALHAATAGGGAEPENLKLVSLLLGRPGVPQKELLNLLENPAQKESLLQLLRQPVAEKLAKVLGAMQEINSHPPQPNTQNFFLFPCFFAGDSGWGEWLFSMEKEQKQQEREERYNLSFFLEMNRLGPLSLQASIRAKTISGQFRLATESARLHLTSHLPELIHILESQGYLPVTFSCQVSKDNIVRQLKESLEEKAAIRRFSLVDISA
ncbi:MAG: flagellar hook-length control protein FliK [Deltaproteobacteria bacterium]|nr:flagellar hook-length control protein FliK [Deltaproteobacteria bacterium]